MRHWCLLLLMVYGLTLGACSDDLKLPEPKGAGKIVLLGEFVAGDSMLIRAGQSRPLSDTGNGQTLELLQGLSVTVQENGAVPIVLTGVEDFLSYTLLTIPYSSMQVVQPGSRYDLVAKHSNLGEATAAVQVPPAFTAGMVNRAFSNYNGDSVLKIDLALSDAASAQHQYIIEVLQQSVSIYGYFFFDGNQYSITDNRTIYDSLKSAGVEVAESYDTTYSGAYTRQECYTTDNSSENLAGESPGKLFKRIFLKGTAWGGSNHRTQILIPRRNIYGNNGQFAETIINIKSVAPDYYTYLRAYDQYLPSLGGLAGTNADNLVGNVKNGFGMVGGVYKQSVRMIY